jgi:hypothetical protein
VKQLSCHGDQGLELALTARLQQFIKRSQMRVPSHRSQSGHVKRATQVAIACAAAAGGSCKTVKTTPLLTIAQGLSALRKAGTSGCKPISAAKK